MKLQTAELSEYVALDRSRTILILLNIYGDGAQKTNMCGGRGHAVAQSVIELYHKLNFAGSSPEYVTGILTDLRTPASVWLWSRLCL